MDKPATTDQSGAKEPAGAQAGSGANNPAQPEKSAEPSDFWTLFDRTFYLCLRVGIIVAVCGFIMWYGFYRDQLENPQASLIDPYDLNYGIQQELIIHQVKGDPDPIFKYHEMNNPYFDVVMINGARTEVGSFETEDQINTVYNHFHDVFRHRGFSVTESLMDPNDKTLTGISDDADETNYIVRVLTNPTGSTRVQFSRREAEMASSGPLYSLDDDFPLPVGQYEILKFSMNPGQKFGRSCQYFSDASVDINFKHLENELRRRGWEHSTLSFDSYDPETGASVAMFRRQEHTMLLNVAPSDDQKWASLVAMTIF